ARCFGLLGDCRLDARLIIAFHDVRRSDDADVDRRVWDRFAVEYYSGGLGSLAQEGGDAVAVKQSRVIEEGHSSTDRNIDPAVDQRGGGLAVRVVDDPALQMESMNQFGPQTPIRVVVSVKPDVGMLKRIVISEIAGFTAEKHPRA